MRLPCLYLDLSQKLAFFLSQITKEAIRSIKITCSGKLIPYAESFGTFATLGMLKHSLGDSINYVNAVFVAKDRGINVSIDTKDSLSSVYKNLITIEITTLENTMSISGCVFDEDKLRIIDINGFCIDIEPSGKIILFKNTDVPGVIGNVGNIMEKNNINIADFRLGRKKENGEALAIIIVDNHITDEVLSELKMINACISVSYAVI